MNEEYLLNKHSEIMKNISYSINYYYNNHICNHHCNNVNNIMEGIDNNDDKAKLLMHVDTSNKLTIRDKTKSIFERSVDIQNINLIKSLNLDKLDSNNFCKVMNSYSEQGCSISSKILKKAKAKEILSVISYYDRETKDILPILKKEIHKNGQSLLVNSAFTPNYRYDDQEFHEDKNTTNLDLLINNHDLGRDNIFELCLENDSFADRSVINYSMGFNNTFNNIIDNLKGIGSRKGLKLATLRDNEGTTVIHNLSKRGEFNKFSKMLNLLSDQNHLAIALTTEDNNGKSPIHDISNKHRAENMTFMHDVLKGFVAQGRNSQIQELIDNSLTLTLEDSQSNNNNVNRNFNLEFQKEASNKANNESQPYDRRLDTVKRQDLSSFGRISANSSKRNLNNQQNRAEPHKKGRSL